MNIITTQEHHVLESPTHITLANDVDPRTLDLSGVTRIDLQFPKFTDGRAYSQAFLLRRRLRFAGELRATGDVLIDQLLQMQRSGFSSAVLAPGIQADAAAFEKKYGATWPSVVARPTASCSSTSRRCGRCTCSSSSRASAMRT